MSRGRGRPTKRCGDAMKYWWQYHFGTWWWFVFEDHRVGPMSLRMARRWSRDVPFSFKIEWWKKP